jgi:galactokinase
MTDRFASIFGRPPVAVASAPGRVNLIGDHTDYNGGYVLPSVLPQRTRVRMARRDDRTVRVASAQFPDIAAWTLGDERRQGSWYDYIQGITAVLLADGRPLAGFEAYIDSDVPVGSGLSSSAALEVAALRGLRELFALDIDDRTLARLAHRAETEFVGAPVGVMDQLICSLGEDGSALFIDTRTLATERLPLPAELGLVVIYSGVDHDLTAGDYGVRRAECEQAAAALGVPQLRDLDPDDPRIVRLPATLQKRVRHVLSENARVLAAVDALRSGDVRRLGALFDASHASLRDDYEVSIPAIDRLCELARRCGAVYGARLTGGGFGGSVVVLADPREAESVARNVARAYAESVHRAPSIVVPWLREQEHRP